jgi:hypothetical protein
MTMKNVKGDKMKNFTKTNGSKIIESISLFVVALCVLFLSPMAYAQYSNSPRQTGEAILDEVLMGQNRFLIKTASNGCTDKGSFKVDVKKDESSSKPPHYNLTVMRIKPDECKAIVDEGALVLFSLDKDLGLTGDLTYTVTNKVYSSTRNQPAESLFSIIENNFTIKFPDIKEVIFHMLHSSVMETRKGPKQR